MHNSCALNFVICILELWSVVEIDEVHQKEQIEGDMDVEMDQMEAGFRETICEVVEEVSLELKRSLRKKRKKTVFNALLDDVINGYKILSKCLDDLITKTTENPDSETFALSINFEGLIETSSTKQCGHLFEIFNKSKSGTEKEFPIIRHPVIALFIWSGTQPLY